IEHAVAACHQRRLALQRGRRQDRAVGNEGRRRLAPETAADLALVGGDVEAGLGVVEHRRRRLARVPADLLRWNDPLHLADEKGAIELRLVLRSPRRVFQRKRRKGDQQREQHHFTGGSEASSRRSLAARTISRSLGYSLAIRSSWAFASGLPCTSAS